MTTVIGEVLLDMLQVEQGGAYVAHPGGGPLNVAVGLQRLGHGTSLMARLSTSPLGETVRRYADGNGLDLTACVDTDENLTLAFATVDVEKNTSYDFYVEGTADWAWSDEELSRLPAATRMLHTGSLATMLAPGAAALARLFTRLRAEGRVLLSFDPNIRPALAGGRADAVSKVEAFVACAHVVKASAEDVSWLYPHDEPDAVMNRWLALGPSIVVVTAGADGCRAVISGGETVAVGGESVAVVDTIGAGDAFQSGLLSGLLAGGLANPSALAAVSAGETAAV
ncbi:MAG: carbohydrate kinase, partial [Nocardioidaceae bacterium]|nr:carbohydrate kinase [Nocardioidaceae bacterium]